MTTARGKGALGLVYIYDEVNANPNGDWLEGFLPALISNDVADKLLAPENLATAALRASLLSSKQPDSFELHSRIRLRVESRHFPSAVGFNVVAKRTGSDPDFADEIVVIGGHLDHCGEHMGFLFPGADDNGSGSACVISVARAFAALPRAPKRTVLFALFGSEERGLIGSKLLSDTFEQGSSSVVAMVNLDMEGEGEGLGAVLSPDRPELEEAIQWADGYVGTLRGTRKLGKVGVRGSDYAPFYLNGVPCLALWSNGPHLHYHQTGDTIYRINPDMLADVTRFAFLSAHHLANR